MRRKADSNQALIPISTWRIRILLPLRTTAVVQVSNSTSQVNYNLFPIGVLINTQPGLIDLLFADSLS